MSLLLEYAGDEGSGTVVRDSSGNGHDAVAASDGWVAGHTPHAFAASGNSTKPGIAFENTVLMSGSKTATLMTWAYGLNLTGSGDIIEIKSAHSNGAAVTIYRPSEGQLQAWFNDTTGASVNTAVFSVPTHDVWTHVACTLSPTELVLLAGGVRLGSVPISNMGDLGDIQLFYAGGTDTKFNQAAVNDSRLFSDTLSDSAVNTYMNKTAGRFAGTMQERDFWAQSSGLTPVEKYSVNDHRRAAWISKLGSSQANYDDLQYLYLNSKTGLNGDIDRMLQAFWGSLSGLTPVWNYSTADHRVAALAQNPLVP